jgi:hypothetical protein
MERKYKWRRYMNICYCWWLKWCDFAKNREKRTVNRSPAFRIWNHDNSDMKLNHQMSCNQGHLGLLVALISPAPKPQRTKNSAKNKPYTRKEKFKNKIVRVVNQLSTTPWGRMGEWRYISTIHDLGTRRMWVVNFTPRPLYPRGGASGTHWIGGWGNPEPVWALWRREKPYPCRESNPDRSVRRPSLYRLRYPGYLS